MEVPLLGVINTYMTVAAGDWARGEGEVVWAWVGVWCVCDKYGSAVHLFVFLINFVTVGLFLETFNL